MRTDSAPNCTSARSRLAVGLAVGLAIGCSHSQPGSRADRHAANGSPRTTIDNPQQENAPVPITIEQVQTAYEQNPVIADDWLNGRTIQVSGPISAIDSDENKTGLWIVIFTNDPDVERTKPNPRFYALGFMFKYDQRQMAIGLQNGSMAVCVGRFSKRKATPDGGVFLDFDGISIKPQ